MGTRLSDEECLAAVEAMAACGNRDKAAAQLGLAGSSFSNRLRRAAERGLDGSIPKPLPLGQIVKGTSTLYRDGEQVLQWVKAGTEPSLEDTVQAIKDAFADYEGRSVLYPPPAHTDADLLTLYPANDWHLGLYAWGREADANWDLDIAADRIGKGMAHLVNSAPHSSQAIFLGGGDLLHSDSDDNKTARSGNPLDVDGRHAKVLKAACNLVVHIIDLILQKHDTTIVRILKGNHDEYSSIALAYFLLAWYRNNERVTVDIDPSLFFWHRFGKVLLGSTHGHTVKIKNMASIMAHRQAEDWGQTKFRYVHGFHLHHSEKIATEGNGVISEIHQAPVAQDAWHYGAGFLSGRSLCAITYHAEYGEISRNRMAVL